MKIKTFYAGTMAEALRSVKEEFGNEGLILSTKEIPTRSSWFRTKPAVEVVAAIDNGMESDQDLFRPSGEAAGASAAGKAEAAYAVPLPKVDKEYSEMRRALYSLTRPAVPTTSLFSDAVSYELYQDLVTNEVDEWLAYKLLDEAQTSLAPGNVLIVPPLPKL
jgi:flagellar biosynthesis GTPase FlhF